MTPMRLAVMILAVAVGLFCSPQRSAGEEAFFTIEGEVRNPGRYTLGKDFRVKDAVTAAGGLTREADPNQGEIVRFHKGLKEYNAVRIRAGKALAGDSSDNIVLLDRDRIVIRSIRERADREPIDRQYVSIGGEIPRPGFYPYVEGMTVRDLVLKGGNTLATSYMDEAELSSVVSQDGKLSSTNRRVINLKRAMAGDPAHNLQLDANDRLFVKRIQDDRALLSVTASGEFRFPGTYTITKGERLSSLIERAGGYGPHAYLRGAVFTRERVRQLQQANHEEMSACRTNLPDCVEALKASGRIPVNIRHLRVFEGSPDDMELEDGDILHIPRNPGTVRVVGAVISEGFHAFKKKWDYRDYITASGGYARNAAQSEVFVIKVDGNVRKLSSGFFDWNDKKERWEISTFTRETKPIEPGDIIVVPERMAQSARLP